MWVLFYLKQLKTKIETLYCFPPQTLTFSGYRKYSSRTELLITKTLTIVRSRSVDTL